MYFVRDQYSRGIINGVNKITAVIDADTADDLPDYNDCNGVDGELTLGTIAFVANEVEFYGLTSDGTWHKHGEESDSSSASSNSASTNSLQTNKALLSEPSSLPEMSEKFYTEDSEPIKGLEPENTEVIEGAGLL